MKIFLIYAAAISSIVVHASTPPTQAEPAKPTVTDAPSQQLTELVAPDDSAPSLPPNLSTYGQSHQNPNPFPPTPWQPPRPDSPRRLLPSRTPQPLDLLTPTVFLSPNPLLHILNLVANVPFNADFQNQIFSFLNTITDERIRRSYYSYLVGVLSMMQNQQALKSFLDGFLHIRQMVSVDGFVNGGFSSESGPHLRMGGSIGVSPTSAGAFFKPHETPKTKQLPPGSTFFPNTGDANLPPHN